jgi:hypothetical protein
LNIEIKLYHPLKKILGNSFDFHRSFLIQVVFVVVKGKKVSELPPGNYPYHTVISKIIS